MILLLETATLQCSVALARPDGTLVGRRDEHADKHQHAERLHVLIDELLIGCEVAKRDLTAIAVGNGPGSFTGLRIGTSAAKGMCAGLGIPLVAPSPLRALQHLGAQRVPDLADQPGRIVPAIDARRMEIYTLDAAGQPAAAIVDADFRSDLGDGPALLIGDGATKCQDVLQGSASDWTCIAAFPSAADLLPETLALIAQGQWVDVADHEPHYLKDFVPGRPKDPLGLRTPTP